MRTSATSCLPEEVEHALDRLVEEVDAGLSRLARRLGVARSSAIMRLDGQLVVLSFRDLGTRPSPGGREVREFRFVACLPLGGGRGALEVEGPGG